MHVELKRVKYCTYLPPLVSSFKLKFKTVPVIKMSFSTLREKCPPITLMLHLLYTFKYHFNKVV